VGSRPGTARPGAFPIPWTWNLPTWQRPVSDIPIIILSGLADEELAIKTVQEGAQDYLAERKFRQHLLARAHPYAIERHRIKPSSNPLLTDELTGCTTAADF